jgi:hypothetical protein
VGAIGRHELNVNFVNGLIMSFMTCHGMSCVVGLLQSVFNDVGEGQGQICLPSAL